MTSRLANRYSAVERLITRYVAGAKPTDFTAAERAQLREELISQPEYRNPRHPHHEKLSQDVRDLFLADDGGELKEAGMGTFARSSEAAPTGNDDAADKGTLFSS